MVENPQSRAEESSGNVSVVMHGFRLLSLAIVLAMAIAGCGKATRTEAADTAATHSQAAGAGDPKAAGDTLSSAAMASCGGADHACCGTCQEQQKSAQAAEKPAGGCPCQRARQAEEASRHQTGS